MTSHKKFGMLRNILRTLGLSQDAANDVVDFIVDLLAAKDEGESKSTSTPQFPYNLRDDFLSAAELSYFKVLQVAVRNRALVLTKVGLRDLFYVKSNDRSEFRIYTNKIDRKHVDFLICDPITLRPLLGIELDDKSHQRKDRQERDAFVDTVFEAAGLQLIHVPVKRGYTLESVTAQLAPYLSSDNEPSTAAQEISRTVNEPPNCPKCDSVMVLRTAKKGANAGNQFWGCSNYPQCRGVVMVEATE